MDSGVVAAIDAGVTDARAKLEKAMADARAPSIRWARARPSAAT
jgi:hypothetical protein